MLIAEQMAKARIPEWHRQAERDRLVRIDILLAHADSQRVLNVLTEISLGLIEACDVDTRAWLAVEQAKTLEAS
jgi:hypothetical protein